MKVYFIAVVTEADRIRFMQEWLRGQGCDFNHVEGVLVSDITGVPQYHRTARLRRYGFNLTETEIGCFLSHRSCWQKIAESGEPGLILESDAALRAGVRLEEVLGWIEKNSKYFDMVRLFGTFQKNEKVSRVLVESPRVGKLVQSLGDPMGAVAYVISPKAAKKLFDSSMHFHSPVDVFLGSTWLHKQRFRGIKPYPFTLADFPSTIGSRRRPQQSTMQRLKIELSRCVDDVRRILYIPFHFFR